MSVAAAVIDGDRVLAIRRRDNGKWEPPGGTLELDETIVDGLQREVAEETGLTISRPIMSGIYKNMSRGIIALVFRCVHDGGEPTPTAEAAEVRWLVRREVEALLDPAYAVRLLDAFEPGIAVRAHDGTDLVDT